MPRRRALLAAAAAALALVAAGCGGDDSSASGAEEWADSFCTSLATWADELKGAGAAFQDPGSLSADSFGQALQDVEDATRTFVGEVKELGPPDTEAGEEIQDELSSLADTLEDQADELRAILDDDPGSITAALGRLSEVTGILANMSGAIGSAFTTVSDLDSGGELQDAFEQTESCNTLTGQG